MAPDDTRRDTNSVLDDELHHESRTGAASPVPGLWLARFCVKPFLSDRQMRNYDMSCRAEVADQVLTREGRRKKEHRDTEMGDFDESGIS